MGRKKKIILTDEQLKYRECLKRKIDKINVKILQPKIEPDLTLEDIIGNKFYYLNNCIFWINEFQEGRVDMNRLYQTLDAIHEHVVELKKAIKNNKKTD